MTHVTSETRTVRRRGDALEQQLLQAAWDELIEVGWDGFQIERVAARCGAGKTSIYRRWPNRAALLLAAFQRMGALGEPELPAGGDLRTMLIAVLDDVAKLFAGPFGDVARGVVSEIGPDSDWARRQGPPVRAVSEIVAAAVERGELPAGALHPRLLEVGPVLVSHQFLASGRPPEPHERTEVVDLVWLPALKAAGKAPTNPGDTTSHTG